MKTILAVDDNRDDLFFLARTLSLAGIEHRLLTARDGLEAEAFLGRSQGYNDRSFPSLIFLDLYMPRLNGLAFLDRFKQKSSGARIPVVVLSSFDNPGDKDRALDLGAAACLQKPPTPQAVRQLVKALTDVPLKAEEGSSRTRRANEV